MINRLHVRHYFALRSPDGLSEGPVEGAGSEDFGGLTEDDAEAALMGVFEEEEEEGAESGEERTTEGGTPEQEGSPEGEGTGEPDAGDGEGAEGEENPAGEKPGAEGQNAGLSDDLTLDVNGTSVKLGELKALAGQAIKLTEKSREIAQREVEVTSLKEKYAGQLTKQKEFVDGLFSELANTDMAKIKAESSPEDWARFSAYAQNIVKLHSELSEGVEAITPEVEKAKLEANTKAAQACATALLDPATGIPGYTQKRHDENAAFAEKMGLSREATDALYDPAAWRLIDFAHKYAELQDRASKVAPKPAVAAPKTPALKNEGQDGRTSAKGADALSRLRQTGSEEDAVSALMALGL